MQATIKKKFPLVFLASCIPALCVCLFVGAVSHWQLGFKDSLPFDYYIPGEDIENLAPEAIAQLPAHQWTPVTGNRSLNPSIAERELWLRVRVPARETSDHVAGGSNLLFIYSAEFFLDAGSGAAPQRIGASNDPKTWAWATEPSFRVSYLPRVAQNIYVKIHKRSLFAIPFFVQNDQKVAARTSERLLVTGVVVGCMLGIITICCLFFLILRRHGFWRLAAFQACALSAMLLYSGDVLQLFPELAHKDSLYILTTDLTVLLAVFCAHRAFTTDFLHHTRYQKLKTTKNLGILTGSLIAVLPLSSHIVMDYIVELYVLTIAIYFSKPIIDTARKTPTDIISLAGLVFAAATISTCLAWSGFIINSIYVEILAIASTSWISILMMSDTARKMNTIRSERKNIAEILKSNSKHMTDFGDLKTATTIDVSIMFIDIVGFSTVAETEHPNYVFELLSSRMLSMIKIIERHGGTIDRSLGDGLLCFFPSSGQHHAVSALNAAREIQSDILKDMAVNLKKKTTTPILPVRIGIHSDKVIIGNMGGGTRIDFSLVGQGVNQANRLEQACSPFRILISSKTHANLIAAGMDANEFKSVQIPQKHHTTLLGAFEFDPFREQRDQINASMKQQANQSTIKNRYFRYTLRQPHHFRLNSPQYQFAVEDFSIQGFRAISSTFLAQGAIVELSLDTGDKYINQSLDDKLLTNLQVQVRWSRSSVNGYEHGLKIIGDTPVQSNYRLGILLTHPSVPLAADIAI